MTDVKERLPEIGSYDLISDIVCDITDVSVKVDKQKVRQDLNSQRSYALTKKGRVKQSLGLGLDQTADMIYQDRLAFVEEWG